MKDIPEDALADLKTVAAELRGLLAPLALADGIDELVKRVEQSRETYEQLAVSSFQVIAPYLTPDVLQAMSAGTSEELRKRIDARADMFSGDQRLTLEDVLESYRGFSAWVLGFVEATPGIESIKTLTDSGPYLVRAQMTITALSMLLFDLIDWRPEGVNALVEAADEYLSKIEDIFLARSPIAANADQASLSIAELRKRLAV